MASETPTPERIERVTAKIQAELDRLMKRHSPITARYEETPCFYPGGSFVQRILYVTGENGEELGLLFYLSENAPWVAAADVGFSLLRSLARKDRKVPDGQSK